MKSLTPNQIAWLIPTCIFIHQLEEYLTSFPSWFSDLLNASLSNQDFLIVNGTGLFLFFVFALTYSLGLRNNFLFSALGTLVFVNGVIHPLLSIYTVSYSPGTISSIFLLIPLGVIIFKKIMPMISENERMLSIVLGIGFLYMVNTIARNM